MQSKSVNIEPLVSFRILFGMLGVGGLLWSLYKGDLAERFYKPDFFFAYEGWEWIPYLGDGWILWIYVFGIAAALGIALGALYRPSVLVFGLCFSYLHSIDATNYINHYYLIWLFSVLLLLVPANACFSLDLRWGLVKKRDMIPRWMIFIFQLQLGLVYSCAGIAKLNPDWLFNAMPLKIWLLQHKDFPLLGGLFEENRMHYAMSWLGAFYDLTIVWWLAWRKSRVIAYFMVLIFHLLTAAMFDIGLFPPLMICATLIFFSPEWHKNLLNRFRKNKQEADFQAPVGGFSNIQYLKFLFLILFFLIQIFLPFRYLFFTKENIRFTQDYYRYGWRVMLVENQGFATFTIRDSETGQEWTVDNEDFLTPYQIKRMSVQPEHIRQFAHHLADFYKNKYHIKDPIVTVAAFVAVNGEVSRTLIDPKVNLAKEEWTWGRKKWVRD